MCGIAGVVRGHFDVQNVLDSLSHRGPDASGHVNCCDVDLFHTRLSIQDLSSAANQPMQYQHYTIVFNGEIYNHLELRQRVPDHPFKTQSDTESILVLFEMFGVDVFEMFDGAFAMAIVDQNQRTITFARDRMGKKPLFYYHKGSDFAFASELLSLKTFTSLSISTDPLEFFLRFGFFLHDGTPYQYVNAVPAGSYGVLEIDHVDKGIIFEPYFDLLACYKQPKITDDHEALLRVESALKICVKRRLESSSIEVGSFLSGGIDSSLIVAMASEYTTGLKTFTVAFEGAYDESHLSELVAKRYQTQHTRLEINLQCLSDDIEKILISYGRPFMDSSCIPSYYVSQEAKKHVSVILNGDGADELFAGYRRYIPFANYGLFMARFLTPLLSVLPKPQQKMSLYNYLHRLLCMSGKQGADLYASATIDSFEDYYAFKMTPLMNTADFFIRSILQDPNLSALSSMLYLDAKLLLFSDLLPKMDIATMRHALEARSPFLGLEMLELAPRLNDRLKVRGKVSKFVLRELAKKYLPLELVNAPKRGFEVPLSHWVDHTLKDQMIEKISQNIIIKELIAEDFLSSLLYQPQKFPAQKRAKMLFSLFSLAVWYDHHQRQLA